MANTRFGWHSGMMHCTDAKIMGDLYIQDDIVFSDVSAGSLGVTGGIDMTATTSAIGINMSGGTFSDTAIKITGVNGQGIYINKTASNGPTVKAHCHLLAATTNAVANEFKGEFLSTTSTMDGIASHFHMAASNSGIMRAVLGVAYLDAGKTLSGTNYLTGSWLAGGVFSATAEGVLNGTGIVVAGVVGQVGGCTGTLTAVKYMTAVMASSARTGTLSSGESSLLLCHVDSAAAGATVDYGIQFVTSTKVTTAMGFSGTYTNGIDLTGATMTEGSDNTLLSIGSYSAAKTVALATTGFYTPFQINLLSSTNPSGGETIMSGGYIKVANNTIDQPAMNSTALSLRNTIGTSLVSAYGLQSHMAFVSTAELDGNGTAAAVSGKITLTHANASGVIAAGYFTLDGAFSPTAPTYGLWVDCLATSINSGVVIAGAGGVTSGLRIAVTTCATGINLTSATTTGILVAGASTTGISVTGISTTGISVVAATQAGLSVTCAALAVGDNYSGVRVAVTSAAANNAYGTAAYFDTTITGAQAGHVYGIGSWINFSTGFTQTSGQMICAQDNGVYMGDNALTITGAKVIFGMRMESFLGNVGSGLHGARVCPFSINTANSGISALFACDGSHDLGVVGGAGTDTSELVPLLIDNSGNKRYVRLYSSP